MADVSPDDAWKKLKEAATDRDPDDAKEAIQEYVKVLDGAPSYKDIQMRAIEEHNNLWLIPLERGILGAFTNMELQGNTRKKYTVSYRISEKPGRARDRDGWPESKADIISRLDVEGEKVDSGK